VAIKTIFKLPNDFYTEIRMDFEQATAITMAETSHSYTMILQKITTFNIPLPIFHI